MVCSQRSFLWLVWAFCFFHLLYPYCFAQYVEPVIEACSVVFLGHWYTIYSYYKIFLALDQAWKMIILSNTCVLINYALCCIYPMPDDFLQYDTYAFGKFSCIIAMFLPSWILILMIKSGVFFSATMADLSKRGFCWRVAIDVPDWMANAYGPSLDRSEFLQLVEKFPSRLWLSGKLCLYKGHFHILPLFDSRSHRRIRYAWQTRIDEDTKVVHVDVNNVINIATAANASTMGLNEANQRFKAKTSSVFRVNMNLTPKQEKELRELAPDIPFDIVGGKNNTSDHPVLAAGRFLIREMFESLYRIRESNLPTLVIGSAYGDLNSYEINDKVDHYFAGVESKDYLRTMVPLLERFSNKLKKNLNGAGSRIAAKTYMAVFTTVRSVLDAVKLQEGWKMGLFTKVEELKTGYERLVFRDIYEVGPKQMEDLFIKTGANHAVGYGIYPDELVFDNVAPDKHYRYDYNRFNDRATITYRNGFSNGYSHNKSTWAWFLKNPVLSCPEFDLVTEIVARVGPYAIYSITKRTGKSDYVPRTIGLPRQKHRALVMDVAAVFKGADVEKSRFAVNIDEWVAVRNWAMSLQVKALAHDVIVMYIRRMIGGVSLVNKELVTPWTLKPVDASRLALAVLVDVRREKGIVDDVLDEAFGFAPTNLLMSTFRKPAGLLDGLARYLRGNGISNEIAIYPDNELFTMDSTPLIRGDQTTTQYNVGVDTSVEHMIGCDFCAEIAPKLGKQVTRCENAGKPGLVDVSMTDDELRVITNELQNDDDKPGGLAKLFQDVKQYVPKKGFENTAKFSYVLGAAGVGKSYLIRSIAADEDAIYVPFMKLKTDYEAVPHPENGRPRDLRFATTHRGLKLGLCKRLFIDEFTALDWRYIKMVIRLTCPDEVFIVGDTRQTGIRTGLEGIHVADAIDIDSLPRHRLLMNFRNGRDTVHWMNRQCDYGLGSVREYDPANPSIIVYSPLSDKSKVPKDGEELFFTHANAQNHGRSPQDSDKYTVRSFQGSTVDKAVVYLTANCLQVASAHGMLLVALSRARECTHLIHDGSPEVCTFLGNNNLPIDGPYQMVGDPVPEPVNEFTRELRVPSAPAMDFARQVLANESVEIEAVDKTWFELSSYQVLCLAAFLIRCFGYKITSTYMIALAVVGTETNLRKSSLFKLVSAGFLLNTIGQLHQYATAVLFVFDPNGWIYKRMVNQTTFIENEVSVLNFFFGRFLSHVYSVGTTHFTWLVRLLEGHLGKLPVGYRIPFLIQPTQMLMKSFGPIEAFPSRLGISSSALYFVGLMGWILYYKSQARIVVRVGQNSKVSTASISGSIFTTTLVLKFSDTTKAHTMDYLKSTVDTSKQFAMGYVLLASTWMPQCITGISRVDMVDLEVGVPDGQRVTPCDSFRGADQFVSSTVWQDPDMHLTNAEQVEIPSEIRNGEINRDDFMVPIDKKRRVANVRSFFRFSSGYGYHFSKDSVAQSVKAIATRYLNKKAPSKKPGPSQERVALDVVNLAMLDMFVPTSEIHHREDLMEIAIAEASAKAKQSSYDTQVSIDSFDAHKVRMFMKETFKPGPLSNLKPFKPGKAGMGVSPFDKSAHVVFSTCMRYINLLILNSLKSNVIYDNRYTEEALQERVNAQLANIPNVAVNGVTDFVMYDSQQDDFCQLLTKQLFKRFGVSEEMLDHYYSFCKGSQVLSDGGLKGKLGVEKLSGDPATLLTNSMLGGMITNYLFRGQGPFLLLIKGDDGFKRQLNLKVNHLHAANLNSCTRLQSVMAEEDPAEFCGKIVGSVMCDNIYRKLTSLVSRNFADYTHYMQVMESVRVWVARQEVLQTNDFEEFIAQNAELLKDAGQYSGLTGAHRVNSVISAFETIKSFTHLDEYDFYECFPKRTNPRLVPASSYASGSWMTSSNLSQGPSPTL
jgi:hypothetical protein